MKATGGFPDRQNKANLGERFVTPAEAGVQPPFESRGCSWGTLSAGGCLDSRLRGNDRVVSGGCILQNRCAKQSQFVAGRDEH